MCVRCVGCAANVLTPPLPPQSTLDVATDVWGIKVERVEIKDVKLPHQLQRAMAAEAEASREARAKVPAQTGQQAPKKAHLLRLAEMEAFVSARIHRNRSKCL